MGAGPGMMFRKNSGAPVVFCSWILARIISSNLIFCCGTRFVRSKRSGLGLGYRTRGGRSTWSEDMVL